MSGRTDGPQHPYKHSVMTDPPYTRIDITRMTQDQIEAHVDAIRARRMELRRQFEEKQELRNQKMQRKTRDEIDHVIALTHKDFEIVDKKLTKIVERLAKLTAMRHHVRFDAIEMEEEDE